MTLLGLSLVGYSRAAASGRVIFGVDPGTGAALEPPYQLAAEGEVDRAARLAANAFEAYRALPGRDRAAFLEAIAAGLEARGDALEARATAETALPAARIRGELGRTCGQLRMFAALVREGSWVDARIDRAQPARQPLPKPDVRSMLRALGPVAVFGPSNFPLAFTVAGGDTASALAAGSPVVVKAHSAHPGTSELAGLAIVEAARACGMPEGVFSLLFGDGPTVGQALVRHPAIRAVGFTGSQAAGRALMDLAAARSEPIPVFAEMGSLNPVVILPGALAARGAAIAEGLHASVTVGVGQFCTNPGLVLVEAGPAAEAFAAELAARLAATAPGTMLYADLRAAYAAGVGRLAERGGVEALALSDLDEGPGRCRATAALFRADAATFLADDALREEVFGPATLLVSCRDAAERERVVRALEGHLTATVHGEPEELAQHGELLALLETKAGRIVINGFPTGVEVCPSMVHGGPYPAASDARFTSVGTRAIARFARPVCYQGFPDAALPPELQDANPLGIARLVDGTVFGRAHP
jgi:NADP-dependent aldehyde dehydrogenase